MKDDAAYLVLTVHATLDVPSLDELYDVLLDLVNRPPKGFAHAIQFNRRKGLEVQHHCPVPDLVR